MKSITIFCLLLVAVYARPQTGKDATIVKYETDAQPDGSYKFNVETSDGFKREEEGTLKDLGGEEGPAIVTRGSFSWTDPESGQTYTINFIADENGYQPTGDHLPKRK